ncbi:hypothetical protein [Yersinia ruckeri]|uniref:hypothetical protein n=1 Tax=Yersinia ruckeri TaxID=29486 RepID=UPI002238423F|nr:hypothetical protein [Yersinia ruckeri]MCW6598695.1 hypothetical protein [Yersinia ruckeri]
MYYSDVDIRNILEELRNSPSSLQYLNAESQFMWDQLMRKMTREFEIHTLETVPELFNANTGLFKPNVYIINWYPDIETDLEKFTAKYSIRSRVILRLTDANDNDKNELRIKWLRNHNTEEMINAFLTWLGDRGARAERGAIEILLKHYSADEIKNLLDFIALRDDNLVTEAAVVLEMDQQEENIFLMQEHLIYGRKYQMLEQYDLLLEKNPPLRVVASLLTQTRRIMQAIQAKRAGASAEQLAEITKISPNYARRCLDTVKNPFFKEVNAVLLFNTLIGLKESLMTSSQNEDEVLRTGLLRYIASTGYAGA